MTRFRTLAEIPTLAADAGEGAIRSRIVVAQLGKYRDPRYGRFAIDNSDYEGWSRNLQGHFGGRLAIDFDHGPEKGGSSEAAGWIVGLEKLTGAALKASDSQRFARLDDATEYVAADVEWTPAGAQAIREKRWLYISPTFASRYEDEQGVDLGRALVGAGLTNRPFLRSTMPVLSLSRDEFVAPAEPVNDPPAPSDSRPHMTPLDNIARALGLDRDADEATVLAKVTELAKAPAVPEGKVLLDATAVADLTTKAALGEAAHGQLGEIRFTTAWDRAVRECRAAPSQEETMRELARVNLDLAIKTLDGLPKIVPDRAKAAGDGSVTLEAPDGVDEDRYNLARRAEALALERGISVEEAAERIFAEQGAAA